jgi:signal transduction histidine kinase
VGDTENPNPFESFSCGLTPVPEAVRVLIVDDDPDVHAQVRAHLAAAERPAFVLDWAASLGAGLDALGDDVDAILLDLHLSDARGLETLRRMRAAAGDRPIVVLTGVDDPTIEGAIVRAGGDDYLEKDGLTGALLARTLVYAIDRRARETELAKLNAELEARVGERTRALRDSNAELARANRDLAAFAHTASHDLRAPLRAIRAHMSTIREDAKDSLTTELDYCLERAMRSSDRMFRVLDGIDALSRIGRSPFRRITFDASEIVWDLVEELRDQDPGRVVTVEIDDPLTVSGDPHLFELILRNLIGNAWKFTRHASAPRVTVRRRARADGAAEYVVADNGIGIDAARAAEIFQPFVRLDGQFEGDGIGLATVQRAVQRHGGQVHAAAPIEGGTEIAFTLGAPTG